MPSSVWSGYLTFGLISLPVRLAPGARGDRIAFHMLHRTDHVRVKQQLICPADEKVLSRNEIVKGYEYSKGEYVILEPAEIKAIEPKTARAMEILEFVQSDEVDPVYFEASYYMMPEEAGRRPYALLSRAMADSGYLAVAKLTMHNREYTVVLRPHRGGLMLHTLYYQNEVRQAEHFAQGAVDLREAEIKVARQLIEALEAKWNPAEFHDTFEENLRKLIQARLEGKKVTAVEKPRKLAPPADLMEALKGSLAQMRKKPPQRVTDAAHAKPIPFRKPAKSTRKIS
jgi:DNA end-binding protein Ku